MNKEKVFIEGYEVGFLADTTGARGKKIQVASGEIVSIDERFIYKSIEREKVTIPQFVADYIEFKKANNFHVYGAMRTIEDYHDKKVSNWFYEGNIEKFCLAWILGYEVEKEKQYKVKIKGVNEECEYLVFGELSNTWKFRGLNEFGELKKHHTRKELEEANFGWVFDCPGIEVEELE